MFYMRPEGTNDDDAAVVVPVPIRTIDPHVDEPVDWRLLAACRGMDPVVFHPSEGDEGAEAKAVCARCPVCQDCLDHALAVREKDGVWGGMTAPERRRLIRRMRRSA